MFVVLNLGLNWYTLGFPPYFMYFDLAGRQGPAGRAGLGGDGTSRGGEGMVDQQLYDTWIQEGSHVVWHVDREGAHVDPPVFNVARVEPNNFSGYCTL